MTAPEYLVFALMFAASAACAQATPSGPGLSDDDDPETAADASPVTTETPDADVSQPSPDAPVGAPDASIQPASAPLINEFVADHLGSDTNEFVEIFGSPGTDYSDHTILVVEGDIGAGPGTIDQTLAVGSTDGSGMFATSFGSNLLENGTITLLLVQGFTGSTGEDIDTNDDGQIDNEPWTELIDAVAVTDGDAGDLAYAAASALAPDYDGGTLQVGGASRMPNGQDTDSVSDWARNDFDGDGLACCTAATADPGEALNTPGQANTIAP